MLLNDLYYDPPLPVAADVGVLQVEGGGDARQEAEGQGQSEGAVAERRHGHLTQSCTFTQEKTQGFSFNRYINRKKYI